MNKVSGSPLRMPATGSDGGRPLALREHPQPDARAGDRLAAALEIRVRVPAAFPAERQGAQPEKHAIAGEMPRLHQAPDIADPTSG